MIFQIQSKKILLIVTFLYMLTLSDIGEGITCFKCFASQPGHEKTDLLCSRFDRSSRFHVNCTSSTLCMKRAIYSTFKNSIMTTVERDCAPQKRTEPIYSNNKWYNREEIVTTAYETGCFTGEDRGAPAGPSEYCFCDNHLCNSIQPMKNVNTYTFLLITALVFTVQ